MNIYRIWQDVNNDYDTYDSAVVVAASEKDARKMHPSGSTDVDYADFDYCWCKPEEVKVELIGTALTETPTVICASFNAG